MRAKCEAERRAGRFVIDVESFGESKPAAKTSDSARDGRSRGVEVTLDEGGQAAPARHSS